MSWSTGKDSAYALYKLKKDLSFQVTGLFTTVNKDYERVAMHSTRQVLLEKQADALGLPLEIVYIPANCSNEIYAASMESLVQKAIASGVEAIGFGDLFLQDIRNYREQLLAKSGIEPVFPLWQIPTHQLAQEMASLGFEAILTCIDPSKLPTSFAGRNFNSQTIRDFPKDVDPCGENGEFHTFVYSSPNFNNQIPVTVGEVVERDGFVFADVIPVN